MYRYGILITKVDASGVFGDLCQVWVVSFFAEGCSKGSRNVSWVIVPARSTVHEVGIPYHANEEPKVDALTGRSCDPHDCAWVVGDWNAVLYGL